MRAVLPGSNKTIAGAFVGDIQGPRVEAIQAVPAILEAIRSVELGKAELRALPLDRSSRMLVLINPAFAVEDVLFNWRVLKLGMFSTTPVKYLALNNRERTANRAMILTVNDQTSRALHALQAGIGAEELEEDVEEVEDYDDPEEPPAVDNGFTPHTFTTTTAPPQGFRY